MYQVDGDNIFH